MECIRNEYTGIAMNATGISIPEDIDPRFAKGHMAGNESELVFLPQEVQLQVRWLLTVNDLLKYVSANIGLIDTKLNGAMETSHLIRHPFTEIQFHLKILQGMNLVTPWVYRIVMV